MKSNWKLSVIKKSSKQSGISQVSETFIRLAQGQYKTFEAFEPPQVYTAASFKVVRIQACTAFKNDYKRQNNEEYDDSDNSILGNFAQLYLDANGQVWPFVSGHAKVGLVREGKLIILSMEGVTCQEGDLWFINLTGNASLQITLEAGQFENIENFRHPVWLVQVEALKEETIIAEVVPPLPPAPKKKLEAAVIEPTPVVEPLPDLSIVPHFPPKKKSGLLIGSIVLVLVMAAAGGWHFWPQLSSTATTVVEADSLVIDVPNDSLEEPIDASIQAEVVASPFPLTDSLLKDYYANSPRDIYLLDQALEALDHEEQDQNPTAAAVKRKELTVERKALIKKLAERFYEYLSQAQQRVEEGKWDEAETALNNSSHYLTDTLGDSTTNDPTIRTLWQIWRNRQTRLENLRGGNSF